MLLHRGRTRGFMSHLSWLPDVNIGVFYSTTTGQDLMSLYVVPMYIKDLLLGENPFLNLTTACTFPEPWSPLSTENLSPDKPGNLKSLGNQKPQRHENRYQRVDVKQDRYVGTYGNLVYGNITVYQKDNALMFTYDDFGVWKLEFLGVPAMYYGHGQNDFWPLDIQLVQFYSSIAGSDIVDLAILSFGIELHVFVRDLKMSEAYPPPDPDECTK